MLGGEDHHWARVKCLHMLGAIVLRPLTFRPNTELTAHGVESIESEPVNCCKISDKGLIFPPPYSLRANCADFFVTKIRSSLLHNLPLNLIIGP